MVTASLCFLERRLSTNGNVKKQEIVVLGHGFVIHYDRPSGRQLCLRANQFRSVLWV